MVGGVTVSQHDAAQGKNLTNRRSRGPCSTEALIVEPLVDNRVRCMGMVSGMADGAIAEAGWVGYKCA